MSLGIFSFDLAALINSLSDLINISEMETSPTDNVMSLDVTEDVLQTVTVTDTKIDDILMAAALSSAVTSVISTEAGKKENTTVSTPAPAAPKPTAPAKAPSNPLDEETRKEIEALIKSLQTSVVFNYRSSDIIDEDVSLNTVANFPRREIPKETENKADRIREDRKREEQKLEILREELRRAMLKNNSEV